MVKQMLLDAKIKNEYFRSERKKTRRAQKGIHVSVKKTLIRLLFFLFLRTVIFDSFAPFGLIYLANQSGFTDLIRRFFFASFATFSTFDKAIIIKYVPVQIIYLIICNFIDKNKSKKIRIQSAILVSCLLFISSFFFSVFSREVWRISGLIEVLFFLLVSKAVNGTRKYVSIQDKDAKEQIKVLTCILVFAVVIRRFRLFSGFSFANCFSVFVILLVSLINRTTVTTAVAMLFGVINGIENFEMFKLITVYAWCSFFSCSFSKYKRCGASIGFLFGYLILIFYSKSEIYIPINLVEVLSGILLLFVVSESNLERILNFLDLNEKAIKTVDHMERFKKFVEEKVEMISNSFWDLSRTLSRRIDKNKKSDYAEVSELFDDVANKVCVRCSRCNECWVRNFNNTYQTMFKMLEILEAKNSLSNKDIPHYFKVRCRKLMEVRVEMQNAFDMQKNNYIWRNKINENKKMITEQLENVTTVMDNLKQDIKKYVKNDHKLEKEIEKKMSKKYLKFEFVEVSKNFENRYSVKIRMRQNMRHKSSEKINYILNSVLGRNMVQMEIIKDYEKKEYTLGFKEMENFVVSEGVASKSAEKVSGDNHSIIKMNDGKYIVALSDGMGKGCSASRESDIVIELLQKLMESGFEKNIAIKLINTVMLMSSSGQKFSTLDLCIVDLYTGRVEFIKNGAYCSFLKHENILETIGSDLPPVGVLPTIETRSTTKFARDGDYIILTSDGIENNLKNAWLNEYLLSVSGDLDPEVLANQILTYATEHDSSRIKDDVTVIVLKLKQIPCEKLASVNY